jgi:hypothetical protein
MLETIRGAGGSNKDGAAMLRRHLPPKLKSDDQNFTVIPEYTVDSVQLPLLIVGEILHTVLVL